MLKPKFRKILTSLLLLPMCAAIILSYSALAQTPGISASAGAATAGPSCTLSKTNWWCKGDCKFQDNPAFFSDPKLGADRIASCQCDGTPNLTGAVLKSCQSCKDPNQQKGCLQNNPITKRINQIINVLSGLVAVVVTASIIIGGIQYAISGESANQVQAAKKRMVNSAIALIIFILTFALLQWLIPGGL